MDEVSNSGVTSSTPTQLRELQLMQLLCNYQRDRRQLLASWEADLTSSAKSSEGQQPKSTPPPPAAMSSKELTDRDEAKFKKSEVDEKLQKKYCSEFEKLMRLICQRIGRMSPEHRAVIIRHMEAGFEVVI